jgi:chemotaxis protein MotA
MPKKEVTRSVGRREPSARPVRGRHDAEPVGTAMDLATIIGYLLAWGSLLYGMHHASHGALGAYIKPGEILLVGGCALGVAIASMPLHSIMSALSSTKKMLFGSDAHIEHLIKEMVSYAETARRDGVLALESVAREAPDPFLRRGLQLTIDGTDPEIIERIMRIEIESMLERHKHGKHFWASLAKFGPGCGLIACLTAQVAMFRNLAGDPAVIGAALAVALVGTLYGALLQNLVAGPVAEKLGLKSKEEAFAKEIILQGVLSIQAGNNPRVVEMQLLSFLSNKQQAAMPKAA